MAIWISWNMESLQSLNYCDSFRTRKFENQALAGCRPGPTLSLTTISFQLQTKVAEEIDVELCSYGQLSKVQMLCDQGHINIHSMSRTTSVPKHVTVVSCTTETWPFEFCKISTFGKVWTLVIAFLEGNSKIGLRHAVVQVPYYHQQSSVLSSSPKWQKR